jgi:hypothetical protein
MVSERKARMYAYHMALIVRGGSGEPFTLSERYNEPPIYKKRLIGTYRSVKTLFRGIERYNHRMTDEANWLF